MHVNHLWFSACSMTMSLRLSLWCKTQFFVCTLIAVCRTGIRLFQKLEINARLNKPLQGAYVPDNCCHTKSTMSTWDQTETLFGMSSMACQGMRQIRNHVRTPPVPRQNQHLDCVDPLTPSPPHAKQTSPLDSSIGSWQSSYMNSLSSEWSSE